MKRFTTEFIKANCGCYEEDTLKAAYKNNNKESCYSDSQCLVTVDEILNSNIPLKDKYWFFCNHGFTKKQNQQIAILSAEIVLFLYEKQYPNDNRPRKAIEAAKQYLEGTINRNKLKLKKESAAYAAYAAAHAAAAIAAAAAASSSSSAAAAYVVYAADAADAAADAAASATSAAADDVHIDRQLFQILKNACKTTFN
jgi:hypothetical protein